MVSRAEELFEKIVREGEREVLRLVQDEVTEELFLDYKRSADNGTGRALHNIDRANMSRAVCGFANSEGGIVLWGIDCRNSPGRGDVPTSIVPIQNPARFKGWLEGVSSGLTIPLHSAVRHHFVEVGSQDTGIVVSLVPRGETPPYQTTTDQRYLMRAGSSFLPVPHAVLAGLFGRQPQSRVYHNYIVSGGIMKKSGIIQFQIGILVHNAGPGIARDVFANLHISSIPGPNCALRVDRPSAQEWSGNVSFGKYFTVIANTNIRIPPKAHLMPYTIEFDLAEPFTSDLAFEGLVGAGDCPVFPFSYKIPATSIEKGLAEYRSGKKRGVQDETLARALQEVVFPEMARE